MNATDDPPGARNTVSWLVAAILAAGLFLSLRSEVEGTWLRAAVAVMAGALLGGALVIASRRKRAGS